MQHCCWGPIEREHTHICTSSHELKTFIAVKVQMSFSDKCLPMFVCFYIRECVGESKTAITLCMEIGNKTLHHLLFDLILPTTTPANKADDEVYSQLCQNVCISCVRAFVRLCVNLYKCLRLAAEECCYCSFSSRFVG